MSRPWCVSEGGTYEEALANIKEAIELYLEPEQDFKPAEGTRVEVVHL